MIEIRKGTLEDVSQVAGIYEHILDKEEAGLSVTGWIRGVYPTEQTAREAAEAKELFVLLSDGTVAAAAKINRILPLQERDTAPGLSAFMSSMPLRTAVLICVWTPMPGTRRRADCTGIWATGRQESFPVNSTAYPEYSWCVWKRLCPLNTVGSVRSNI